MRSETTLIGMHPLMTSIAIVCAVIAAGILLWYLFHRPYLVAQTKILLLFGFGILPVAATGLGSISSFEHSTHRGFCGSCHVMEPYTDDAADPHSNSLSSIHARNELFGDESCYQCHQDYGMFSTLLTKWGGMSHVWMYYTKFHDTPVEEALRTIELYKPYRNANCIRCHSTEIASWNEVGAHRGMTERIREGSVSCVSRGCHGPSHPFSKKAREEWKEAAR